MIFCCGDSLSGFISLKVLVALQGSALVCHYHSFCNLILSDITPFARIIALSRYGTYVGSLGYLSPGILGTLSSLMNVCVCVCVCLHAVCVCASCDLVSLSHGNLSPCIQITRKSFAFRYATIAQG